jgi:DNA-binding beta-propeller fold protein YncE
MKTSIIRPLLQICSILSCYLALINHAQGQIKTGAPAIDGIGQYDQKSFTAPDFAFDKGGSNDGPNTLGLSSPRGVAVDRLHRRMFIADTESNRVLVFGLTNQGSPASPFPQYVLGQSDVAKSKSGTGATGLDNPYWLAYSPIRDLLFVSDVNNNRVLVFDVATISNGEAAIRVLGQPDFVTTSPTVSDTGISSPSGLAIDDTRGMLFVASSSSSRILVFDINLINNGEAALAVIGKASFYDDSIPSSPDRYNLGEPRGMAYDSDSNRLVVADHFFNRLMIFDVTNITNNPTASHVICQSDFTSRSPGSTDSECRLPTDVSYDLNRQALYVSDSGNNRISVFLSADLGNITPNMSASAFLGQLPPPESAQGLSQTRMYEPAGVALAGDGSLLYVVDRRNNRALLFDVELSTTHEPAVGLLGQYNETSYSVPIVKYNKGEASNGPNLFGLRQSSNMAIDYARRRLFVSDSGNHRVLIYQLNEQYEIASKIPVAVMGKADFATKGVQLSNSTTGYTTGVAYDARNDRLFVADASNDRVLVFDTKTITSGQAATHVLGQPNFNSDTGGINQNTLNSPSDLALDEDAQRLFVAEGSRVMVFDVSSIENGESAIAVLGQQDFTSSQTSASQTQLSSAGALTIDSSGKRLFVTDYSANRVVVFDVADVTNGEAAIGVLCQGSFTSTDFGLTATSCFNPRGLAYDPTRNMLYVSDSLNNRVLAYDVSSIENGEAATHVLGQNDFTSSTLATDAYKMSPWSLALNSKSQMLYVSDNHSKRILFFPTRYALDFSGASFQESVSNEGTVSNSIDLTLWGDAFAASGGQMTKGSDYTITGVPAGLTETITRTSSRKATIALSGAASAHRSSNSTNQIKFTLLDGALKTTPASELLGNPATFSIAFSDPARCFGGSLSAPRVKISKRTAVVSLPAAILPSSNCSVEVRATSKMVKRAKVARIQQGKQVARLSKLARGRWSFSYSVTTVALSSSQTSPAKSAVVR